MLLKFANIIVQMMSSHS